VAESSLPNKNWRVWLWSYAPLFVWIGVIFFFSSNLGSSAHTSVIIEPLLKYFFPDMSDASREFVHACVRKTAHFTEYGILAFWGVRAFAAATGTLFRLRWVLPVVIVAVVASLDEFNQSFEPSRTSSVWDVLLDISGGLTVTLLCFGVLSLWRSRRAASSASLGSDL
jgi:VanZ family protein